MLCVVRRGVRFLQADSFIHSEEKETMGRRNIESYFHPLQQAQTISIQYNMKKNMHIYIYCIYTDSKLLNDFD